MAEFLKVFGRRKPSVEKAKDSEAHFDTVIGGRTTLADSIVSNSEYENYKDYRGAYRSVPELFYNFRLVGRLIANQEYSVISGSDDSKEKRSGSLYDLVENPHPIYTFAELITKAYVVKKVYGFSVLAREKSPDDNKYYWTVLDSQYCKIAADPKTKFMAVEYQVGESKSYYLQSDFIMFEEFNLEDFWHGMSSILPGDLDAQLLLYGKRSVRSNYALGDPPQIALKVKSLGGDEINKIKREAKQRTPEDGRMLIFSAEHFDIHETSTRGGKNHTGLDAIEKGSVGLSLVSDIPPAITNPNTKEYREALDFLYNTTIIPMITELVDKINHFFKGQPNVGVMSVNLFKDAVYCRIMLDTAKLVASLSSTGAITMNEARSWLGLPRYAKLSISDINNMLDSENTDQGQTSKDIGDLPWSIVDALVGSAKTKKVVNDNGTAPGSEGGRNKTD